MSLSLRDFEDANLAGMAAFERWRQEYESGLIGPVADEAIAAVMRSLSPEQREMLKAQDPEAYKELVKRTKVR